MIRTQLERLVKLLLLGTLFYYLSWIGWEFISKLKVDADYANLTGGDVENWKFKQMKIKEQIEVTCQKYGLNSSIRSKDLPRQHYNKKLFNCRNAKVGTTSIKDLFRNLSEGSLDKILRIRNLRDLDSTTISFSFVRNPFERLASAYQNKMIDKRNCKNCKERKLLIEYYPEVSFPNFVDFIIKDSKKNCRTISNCTLNYHWLPYNSKCGYCAVPYTVIGRLETMEEDLHYIGQMAGLEIKQEAKNPSTGGSTRDLARKYFRQLDRKVVKQLYQLYKVDFEMFGYSLDQYVDVDVDNHGIGGMAWEVSQHSSELATFSTSPSNIISPVSNAL